MTNATQKVIGISDPIIAVAIAAMSSAGLGVEAIGHSLCSSGLAMFQNYLGLEGELAQLDIVNEIIEERMAVIKAALN